MNILNNKQGFLEFTGNVGTDLPIITGLHKKYIPIRCLIANETPVNPVSNTVRHHINQHFGGNVNDNVYIKGFSEGTYQVLHNNGADVFKYMYSKIYSNISRLKGGNSSYPNTGYYYNEIFNWTDRSLNVSIGRGDTYNPGYKSLFHFDKETKEYVPLYVLVTEKEYIPYIRQCMVLRKPFHPDSVKLIVNDKLDITRTEYRKLRPRYRKEIKNPFLKSGGEIIETSDFSEVFDFYKAPVSKSLTGYAQILEDLETNFLKSMQDIENCKIGDEIELV